LESILLLKPQVFVTVTHGVSVVGMAGWLVILTGWPVTVGVVDTRYRVSQPEQTLSGRGARVYTAHRGWLGMMTGISAASTGGFLICYVVHCGGVLGTYVTSANHYSIITLIKFTTVIKLVQIHAVTTSVICHYYC